MSKFFIIIFIIIVPLLFIFSVNVQAITSKSYGGRVLVAPLPCLDVSGVFYTIREASGGVKTLFRAFYDFPNPSLEKGNYVPPFTGVNELGTISSIPDTICEIPAPPFGVIIIPAYTVSIRGSALP